MLAQYFRLLTVPGGDGAISADMESLAAEDSMGVRVVLQEICGCKSLVKIKLKQSSPTGQVLNAVISGEDGFLLAKK